MQEFPQRLCARAVIVAIIALFLLPGILRSQDGSGSSTLPWTEGEIPEIPENIAVLSRGPYQSVYPVVGVWENIDCQSGEYQWGNTRVLVFLTLEEMAPPEEWSLELCNTTELYVTTNAKEKLFYYPSNGELAAVIVVPTTSKLSPCKFITPFIQRASTKRDLMGLFPFPAVIETPL